MGERVKDIVTTVLRPLCKISMTMGEARRTTADQEVLACIAPLAKIGHFEVNV